MPETIEVSEDGFINLLRCQNGGALVDELDRELIKGVGAVLDNGGTSKITLQISIKRIRELDAAMTISHEVKVSHPKEDRPTRAMFVTAGNGLADQQPEQGKLSLPEQSTKKPTQLKPASSGAKVTRLDRGA